MRHCPGGLRRPSAADGLRRPPVHASTTWRRTRDTAARLGFSALSANDHMVFSVPWLDGPDRARGHDRALGDHDARHDRVAPGHPWSGAAGQVVGRHRPAQPVAGWSSRSARARPSRTTTCVGLDFDERWARLDESIGALRALWRVGWPAVRRPLLLDRGDQPRSAIRPAADGPPIWVGSWGSDAGLRRAARLADGWLASAYNTTPTAFGEAWARLQDLLPAQGKDPDSFPNALATMWFHITDSQAEADRVMRERLVPTIHRPEEVLRERLPVGPAELFAEKLSAVRPGRRPAGLRLARRRRGPPARAVLGSGTAVGHRLARAGLDGAPATCRVNPGIVRFGRGGGTRPKSDMRTPNVGRGQ